MPIEFNIVDTKAASFRPCDLITQLIFNRYFILMLLPYSFFHKCCPAEHL